MRAGYWNAKNLPHLVAQVRACAYKDSEGWYVLKPEALLAAEIAQLLDQQECHGHVSSSTVMSGLKILAFLGGFGQTTGHGRRYRRRFYPERVRRITKNDLDRYRASLTA